MNNNNPKPQGELLEELAVAVENTPAGEFDWSLFGKGSKCGCIVNVAGNNGVAGLSWQGTRLMLNGKRTEDAGPMSDAFAAAFGLTHAEASAIVYSNPLFVGGKELLPNLGWGDSNVVRNTGVAAKRVRDVARIARLRYEAKRPG